MIRFRTIPKRTGVQIWPTGRSLQTPALLDGRKLTV